MGDVTHVSVEELRLFARELLDHLEEVAGPVIGLEREYFWSIPPEDLYDVYDSPARLTIGQLSESLSNLRRGGEFRLVYDLVWLGDVLRAVGHTVRG